jgi:hypothetical protein
MLYAQTCLQASGQTKAFTLAAGANASWNNPVSLDKKWLPAAGSSLSLRVYQSASGTIVYNVGGLKKQIPGMISIYSVNGKRIAVAAMDNLAAGELDRHLAPGIYFARLEAGGQCLHTTRFLVGR